MASNVHGRPIAQPRGSAGRLGVGASGNHHALRAGGGGGLLGQQLKSPEQCFEEQQRQCRAATILESNEMLVWAGMDLCEVCQFRFFPLPTQAATCMYERWRLLWGLVLELLVVDC